MHKILQTHLLRAFVANLKIYAIYTLYPENFCDKNLAVRKVFPFSDSGEGSSRHSAVTMSVWSRSPVGVGVVIAVERKSPSYKRHSRVTESVWWSWLIARETTARPEIEKERKSQRSMVTRIVWSRHRS